MSTVHWLISKCVPNPTSIMHATVGHNITGYTVNCTSAGVITCVMPGCGVGS